MNTFNLFNAIGFQIILGAPIVLLANSLHASATVLGIMVSFTPLMAVFQLPATRFLPVFGYKRFMLMGWGVRSIFIFCVAAIPLMSFLEASSKLAVVLVCLFLFNLMRGIGSCAFLPWITELIPEGVRGRFLSRDQLFIQIGCLAAMGISAYVMSEEAKSWEYSLVFFISGMSQLVSLFFLRKIPDVPMGEATKKSSQRVPWWAMITYKPFAVFVGFNVLYMGIIGGLGVFTVEYLKNNAGLPASTIMLLSGVGFVAAIVSIPLTSRTIDRVGNRMILRVSLVILAVTLLGWFLLASSVLQPTVAIVGVVIFCGGLAGVNYNIANTRMAMSIMPVMGRNHFFALFMVIASLSMGVAPVVWGIVLDMIGSHEWVTPWLVWRRHSIYFAVVFVLILILLACISKLKEGRQLRDESRIFEVRLHRLSRNLVP